MFLRAATEALEDRRFFSATATFLGVDNATQGSWHGTYGSGGAIIANDSTASLGSGASVSTSASTYTWSVSTTDGRALQTGDNSTRIASTWYGNDFSFAASVSGTTPKAVSLYALDWDNGSRSETVTVSDADTHAVLDTESISSFSSGRYLSWNISGDVLISVHKNSGDNAVISGVFVDSSSAAIPSAPTGLSAVALPQEIDLSWTAATHATSYNVYVSTDGGTTYSQAATDLTTTSFYATGLTNGTEYTYAVTGVNAAGESGKSGSASATPSGHWQTVDSGITPSISEGTITNFSDGASFLEGTYRVNYLSGTMTYSSGAQGYRVNAFNDGNYGFRVAEGSQKTSDDLRAPGTDVQGGTASATVGIAFSHSSGAIGVYLQDDPYSDNVAGSSSPTFSLQELVA